MAKNSALKIRIVPIPSWGRGKGIKLKINRPSPTGGPLGKTVNTRTTVQFGKYKKPNQANMNVPQRQKGALGDGIQMENRAQAASYAPMSRRMYINATHTRYPLASDSGQ